MPGAQPPEQDQDAGQDQQQPQGQSAGGTASQALQQIQSGFETLQKVMQGAQGIDDNAKQLFMKAVQATDAFIQDVTSPAGGDAGPAPQKQPGPTGPMPANANMNAKPMPMGSH